MPATGNPNHPGLPAWPAYDLKQRNTMIWEIAPRIEKDPRGEERRYAAGSPYRSRARIEAAHNYCPRVPILFARRGGKEGGEPIGPRSPNPERRPFRTPSQTKHRLDTLDLRTALRL